ncbi:MAG: MerR family transcriptional regulator [Lentisphaeria bacterium]|nr:MerR family transcriptional regulator [Lentisphaeria bacterium]
MNSIKPFKPSYDRKPKYPIREVSELTGISVYTIRYYENIGLIPGVDRTDGNARLFSDYNISWLHLVNCLRTTGLPVEQVRHYIRLCQKGDSTIRERGEMIFKQKKALRQQIRDLQQQMEVLKYKEKYYREKIRNPANDLCNPRTHVKMQEPAIVPDGKL